MSEADELVRRARRTEHRIQQAWRQGFVAGVAFCAIAIALLIALMVVVDRYWGIGG